jgi:hypothetical protein
MITSSATRRWRIHRNNCSGTRAAVVGVVAALSGAGIALTLAAGPAGAQTTAAPPQPGVTLGVAGEGNQRLDMFYTGTDHQVWMVHMSPMGQNIPEPLGGRLIGGPAAMWIPPGTFPIGGLAVFGRGTDNALWWRHQTSSGWSRWASLGGRLTSKPTATLGGPSAPSAVLVFARGTDGALWARVMHGNTKGGVEWISWARLGGRLLAGTAPAAASNGSGLFAAVVGTDHAVWVDQYPAGGPGFAWHSIGGRTTASPGLAAPSQTAVVAFARGTTANAAWYKEFLGHTPGVTAGWHSLGGRLTSGVTALTQKEGSVYGATSVFALGPDNLAWMDSGIWPALTGWTHVRVG